MLMVEMHYMYLHTSSTLPPCYVLLMISCVYHCIYNMSFPGDLLVINGKSEGAALHPWDKSL
jgi:hypothetical protein